jgi:hypothetical protein
MNFIAKLTINDKEANRPDGHSKAKTKIALFRANFYYFQAEL